MSRCEDPEGWDIVSRTRAFDLTPCAEEGVILSIVLALALVFAVLRSLLLSTRPTNEAVSPKSRLVLRVKLVLLAASTVLSILNVIFISLRHTNVPVYQSYILEPLTIASLTALTYVNHTTERQSSTVVLLNILSDDLRRVLIFKWSTIGIGLISFILECLGPEFDKDSSNISVTESGDHKGIHVEHPSLTANIFSIWGFNWVTPLLRKGASKYITEDDLPSLLPEDESSYLGKLLEGHLKKHSLFVALILSYGPTYGVAGVLKGIVDCLNFLQPQLLRWLLSYISSYQAISHASGSTAADFQAPPPSNVEGFVIVGTMFAASSAQTIFLHQCFQRVMVTMMRVRTGLVTALYSKSLQLSSSARSSMTTGDIVNLMSVDAARLQEFTNQAILVFSAPFQIVLAFISLYSLLGWSAFIGVAVMVILAPVNTFIARRMKTYQKRQMKDRDDRTKLMNELLNNIRSVKLYAWENTFLARILDVRNNREIKMLRTLGLLTSTTHALFSGVPLLVGFSSFACAAAFSGKPLTSDIIFPAIALFILLQPPFAMLGQLTANAIESYVSLKRLSKFLDQENLQEDARVVIMQSDIPQGAFVLKIAQADFGWETKKGSSPTLEDINLHVRKGELVGLMGRVGDGKTSLLSAIIGEMVRSEGEVVLKGTIAYAPQTPWIQSATVRENIVFGHVWDEEFYQLVLEACALLPDLAIMKDGDQTVVGEKGITLSGGQRARISLARAVYARADLVLLDDCLAAVDSHVAKHIFEHVIGPNGILASKARILVTNSIAFLHQFDQILYLRRGIVVENGSYAALMDATNGYVANLIRGHGTSASSGTSTPGAPKSGQSTPLRSDSSTIIDASSVSILLSEKLRAKAALPPSILAPLPPSRTLANTELTQEHSEQGRVKTSVYMQYIKASTPLFVVFFVVAVIAAQALTILGNFVLRNWANHNEETRSNAKMWYYLGIYGAVIFSSTILNWMSACLLWVVCGLSGARFLHDSMISALLKAPLSYFELTPTGRILNLFSRDVYVLDQMLSRVVHNTARTMATALGIVTVIGVSFPPFLLAVIPLGWFYFRVMKYYLASSRELKHLDATTKSPIYAWFSESLAGLSTIRAFNQQAIFRIQNQRRIDRNQICYLPGIAANRWLGVRLEFVGSVIILVVGLLAVGALITTGVDAGLVGLVLSYAVNTTGALNWFVRSAGDVEQNIISVERILHQTEVVPEAPQEIPENKPSRDWPSEGAIEFKEYSTRYRPELDLVLKGINVKFSAAEKVGLIGRTGSGKSTFLLSLFRIIEPVSGSILIDGVDITKIGLHDLRSSICIVPQSPDLFEGTLRDNIDPVGTYSDDKIWIALEQAHLKEYVESLPEKLDAPVKEGGSSLSGGQRQLLCFARALLRKTKILVLDEATSAVDLETDQNIQEVIRGEAFKDVTILTIAHRLNTIMDSDRVLVMDAGCVSELDTPSNLLANEQSMFYSLANSAGLI
ncbi:P-loop containing nucleoside triphosphate hydrolase protein [Flagelloscypha sp. PMI_526]|nr:P-loop containing nucleoside triphosphate hydrolase protein [Flagelloscypha sp. PMI_526]